MKPSDSTYVPVTPGGTLIVWLASATREEAIAKLLEDAKHMPYGSWEAFQKRGYTIQKFSHESFKKHQK